MNILDCLPVKVALREAQKCINQGDHERATKIYSDIISRHPQNTEANSGLRKLKNPTHSLNEVGLKSYHKKLSEISNLFRNGRYHDVLTAGNLLISDGTSDEVLLKICGAASLKVKNYDNAVTLFLKLCTHFPLSADSLNNLGTAFKGLKNYQEAIQIFKQAIEKFPKYISPYINLGNTFLEMANYSEAIDILELAVSIEPKNTIAHTNLGTVYKNNGEELKALKSYETALNNNPDYQPAIYNYAKLLHKLGNQIKSIKYYKHLLAINPCFVEAINNLASIYQEQLTLDEALRSYLHATSVDNNYTPALCNLINLELQTMNSEHEISVKVDELLKTVTTADLKDPKLQILIAIRSFIKRDFQSTYLSLTNFSRFSKDSTKWTNDKDFQFGTAFFDLLILLQPTMQRFKKGAQDHIFHLGESHCLSFAHQYFKFEGLNSRIVPLIVFGVKAYHLSQEQNNIYKILVERNIKSLPPKSVVFVSFGEIDCRPNEGFIVAARKFNQTHSELIKITVEKYINWMIKINYKMNHKLVFFNVPAPVYDNNYSRDTNELVAEIITQFNKNLLFQVGKTGSKYVDIYSLTSNKNGFSNQRFHLDQRHLDAKILQYLNL